MQQGAPPLALGGVAANDISDKRLADRAMPQSMSDQGFPGHHLHPLAPQIAPRTFRARIDVAFRQ